HVYAQTSRIPEASKPVTLKGRTISYAEAIREAHDYCLGVNPRVYLMGLGVPDPKGIFGSTLGLQEKYGSHRVFDIPLSENAVTGVALGSAITGMRPIMTHQRVDFALVSIEQIVNQAAKWHYMFNGQMNAPMLIRMIIGRGWGQGPQHSQSLHAWFAHIPGLKVIMPTTPYDAKGMLIAAVEDDNPVICLEHRWLYGIRDEVPVDAYRVPIDQARVIRTGSDITLIGISYMTLECLRAAELLQNRGVSAEVIDLRSIRPIDKDTILASVQKTGYLLIVDHAQTCCGVESEISALATEHLFDRLHSAPARIGLPDHPTPTSPALADGYYPLASDIAVKALNLMGHPDMIPAIKPLNRRLDQPDATFQGPF
ncbi:MAG: alpha-ketoacid dehydrogenase subunit beta, partial [Desulfatirhabdiaceae bacterium]